MCRHRYTWHLQFSTNLNEVYLHSASKSYKKSQKFCNNFVRNSLPILIKYKLRNSWLYRGYRQLTSLQLWQEKKTKMFPHMWILELNSFRFIVSIRLILGLFAQMIFKGEDSADVIIDVILWNMRLTSSCVRTPVNGFVSNLVLCLAKEFNSSLNDLDVGSRSQGHEKVRTCAVILL